MFDDGRAEGGRMTWVAVAIGGSAALGAGMSASGIGRARSSQFGGPLMGIYRENAIGRLYNQLRMGEGRFWPGSAYQPTTPTPLQPGGLFAGQQGVGASGLYPGQETGFAEAVRQATSRLSGGFANRGFMTPRAIGAIAGSAAQNVLPQFAPLMGQQIGGENILRGEQLRSQDQFSFAAEQLRQQEFYNYLQSLIAAMGGTSTGVGAGQMPINTSVGYSYRGGGGGGDQPTTPPPTRPK